MNRALFPAVMALALSAVISSVGYSQDGGKQPDPKDAAGAARVKVIKVWASDQSGAEKEEMSAAKELKDYRKDLEEQTHKKHFTIEGKVEVQDAIPGKALSVALIEDYKLEITPEIEGKGDQAKLVLLLGLKKGKDEKRLFKLCGTKALIYNMTSLRKEDRQLVLIIQKLPPGKAPAPTPSPGK